MEWGYFLFGEYFEKRSVVRPAYVVADSEVAIITRSVISLRS